MTKELKVQCDFDGRIEDVSVFIGEPKEGEHPINFQSKIISDERGGIISKTIMKTMSELKELADKHHVSFEDLCYYTLGIADGTVKEENPEFNKILIDLDAEQQRKKLENSKKENNGENSNKYSDL